MRTSARRLRFTHCHSRRRRRRARTQTRVNDALTPHGVRGTVTSSQRQGRSRGETGRNIPGTNLEAWPTKPAIWLPWQFAIRADALTFGYLLLERLGYEPDNEERLRGAFTGFGYTLI